MKIRRGIGCWGVALTYAGFVHAQQPTRASREDDRSHYLHELVQQAQAAQAAGNHAGALELGLQVERFSVNPSVLMFIAEEYQALYRPTESREYAGRCVRLIEGARFVVPDREAIVQRCRELYTAADTRFGAVRLVLPERPPAELRVFVGGVAVPQAEWANVRAVPVGEVQVEATAPGYLVSRQRVEVRSRETSEASVQLTPVGERATGAPYGQRPMLPATVEVHVPRSSGPWVLMGTGAALAGAALGVWLGLTRDAQTRAADCANSNPPSRMSPCTGSTSLDDINVEVQAFRAAQYSLAGMAFASFISGLIWRVSERTTIRGAAPGPMVGVQALTNGSGFLLNVGGRL